MTIFPWYENWNLYVMTDTRMCHDGMSLGYVMEGLCHGDTSW